MIASSGLFGLPDFLDAERKDLRIVGRDSRFLHECLRQRTAGALGQDSHSRGNVGRGRVTAARRTVTHETGWGCPNACYLVALHEQ